MTTPIWPLVRLHLVATCVCTVIMLSQARRIGACKSVHVVHVCSQVLTASCGMVTAGSLAAPISRCTIVVVHCPVHPAHAAAA